MAVVTLRRRVITIIVTIAGAYLGLCLVVYVASRNVVFPAPKDQILTLPSAASSVTMNASDGVVVNAVHFPAPSGKKTFVHFHGNGETVKDNLDLGKSLHMQGYGVLLVEYRGYGVSSGTPTEQGLYADADAALDWLVTKGVRAEDVILFGVSLGTGVAVEMANKGRAHALVLVAPYTSVPAVAARSVPFLPMRFLFRDQFDSLSKAKNITTSALILHGDADEVIPTDMGQTLAAAFPKGKFVLVKGGHHMDLFYKDGDHLMQEIKDATK